MARRTAPKPFAPQAYERGAWITWTDADGVTRAGQITDQAPEAGTWWLTSATADDRIETYLLHRLPIRTSYDRRIRDERVARGGDSHLYEVRALAYVRNDRAEVYAVTGDHIAPAVACDEPRAEALARNGQTLIPLTDDEPAETPAAVPPITTEGAAPVALVSSPRTPSVAIARALRALGLEQGRGKDFRVTGHYVNGERRYTYVLLLTRHAEDVVTANADRIEEAPELGGYSFKVSVRCINGKAIPSISNGPGRVRETVPALAEEPTPTAEAPAAQGEDFRDGDLVTVDGRAGEWELMRPAATPGRWEIEAATYGDREQAEADTADVHHIADAPHVRRGDMCVQNYAEQTRGGVAGNIYRLGRWVVEKHATTTDGRTYGAIDDVDTQVVVPAERVASAVCLDVEDSAHRGRIVEAIVTRHAGSFRVTCTCSANIDLTRVGRQTAWCDTVDAARALWAWHVAGEVGPAPAADAAAPVRAEEAPAATDATEVDEDAPAPAEAPRGTGGTEAAEPVLDWRARMRREEQAKALAWSARHAEAVTWAAAGELVRDTDGAPRRVTRPGRTGARVNADRVAVLEAAGFLTTAPLGQGPAPIEVTADGRRALAVWQAEAPAPVDRVRKRERLPLSPLLYGEQWTRKREEFRADEERRRVERERWYAEAELRWAEEDREERRRKAWAVVERITNPFVKRPRGWAPTDEEVAAHGLDPEVVAELRAEAAEVAEVAAEQAPAVEEAPAAPGRPDAPRESRTKLTCVPSTHTLYSVGRHEQGGTTHERHDQDRERRGRRRRHRGSGRQVDRCGRAPGSQPGGGRRAHDPRRRPRPHPPRLQPPHRQRHDCEGHRHHRRSDRHRRLLQLGRHPHPGLTAPAGPTRGPAPPPPAPPPRRTPTMARYTVSARTVDVCTGAEGAALAFASVTVLLVRMGLAELRFWSDLLGGQMSGTAPVEGYEVRATDGALLGVILPLGHRASRMRVEWYDPATDDFYPAGHTDAVMTQGISRVLDHYRRNVGDVPLGRDTLLDPEPVRAIRNRFCPWAYCFDAECVDHGPVWATAA